MGVGTGSSSTGDAGGATAVGLGASALGMAAGEGGSACAVPHEDGVSSFVSHAALAAASLDAAAEPLWPHDGVSSFASHATFAASVLGTGRAGDEGAAPAGAASAGAATSTAGAGAGAGSGIAPQVVVSSFASHAALASASFGIGGMEVETGASRLAGPSARSVASQAAFDASSLGGCATGGVAAGGGAAGGGAAGALPPRVASEGLSIFKSHVAFAAFSSVAVVRGGADADAVAPLHAPPSVIDADAAAPLHAPPSVIVGAPFPDVPREGASSSFASQAAFALASFIDSGIDAEGASGGAPTGAVTPRHAAPPVGTTTPSASAKTSVAPPTKSSSLDWRSDISSRRDSMSTPPTSDSAGGAVTRWSCHAGRDSMVSW